MKKSEELHKQADTEDNDLKFMGLHHKAIREERSEKFEERWLAKFKEKLGESNVSYNGNGKYTFIFEGIKYDFYPKANKFFSHQDKEWEKSGLKKLINIFKIQG